MLDIKPSKSLELIIKCLKVLPSNGGTIKFKRLCFLLNESPSRLLNDKTFRNLITEGVFIPLKETSDPHQEYEYNWQKLKELFINSSFFDDILNACKIKVVIK